MKLNLNPIKQDLELLNLYMDNPKKFEKAIKKATRKSKNGKIVISQIVFYLRALISELESGKLVDPEDAEIRSNILKEVFSAVGKIAYRIWPVGGKKTCSEVEILGFEFNTEGIGYYLTKVTNSFEGSPVRKISVLDFNKTWFFDKDSCLKAINR